MLRFVMLGACALMLAGCGAGVKYAIDEYSGVEVKSFQITEPDGEIYRVFDKPAQSKLMITPSLGRAAGAGFASGLTFGAVSADDSLGPKPEFEKATLAYLASTQRPNCRIIDGYVVVRGQWEFKYDCTPLPAPAATVAAPVARKKGR